MLPLLLVLPLLGDAPLTLDLTDTLIGTSTAAPAQAHLGVVPGHDLRFDLSGQPGDLVLLYTGLDTGTPVPLGTGLLELDPRNAALVGSGVLDANGALSIGATTPPGLQKDVQLRSQAFGIDLAAAAIEPSNALTHVSTDLTGRILSIGLKTGHPLKWTSGLEVIETQTDWDAFWALHWSGTPFVPAPPVDFERDVVLASFWGLTGTNNYTIEFDELVAGPGTITMEQTLHTPGLGCGGSFSMGFPHVFLRVDRVAAADQVDAVTTEIQAAPCP